MQCARSDSAAQGNGNHPHFASLSFEAFGLPFHLDLQLNLLIEQENTKMLKMLKSIAAKVGVDVVDDLHLAALEEPTRPERLIDQIDKASANRQRAG